MRLQTLRVAINPLLRLAKDLKQNGLKINLKRG
jgi:hypothetical protein